MPAVEAGAKEAALAKEFRVSREALYRYLHSYPALLCASVMPFMRALADILEGACSAADRAVDHRVGPVGSPNI